jgi:hypothetical protein
MTAVVAANLLTFNEICFVADTRVSYSQNHFDREFGLQKIIPIISIDKQNVGAIGFSGYLAPIQRIIHHLIVNKQISTYRSPFYARNVAEHIRCFIQEGWKQLPESHRLPFVMMFAAIDTQQQSVFKNTDGGTIPSPLSHPIFLSRMYLFQPVHNVIRMTESDDEFTVIGSGKVITRLLYPNLNAILSFGHPYDNMHHFRPFLTTSIISDLFEANQITSVGGPYWAWHIMEPERPSKWYWHWGVDSSSFMPDVQVEKQGNDFVVTNTHSKAMRTILHILNWRKGIQSALA